MSKNQLGALIFGLVLAGMGLAIWGQVKFDYAKTDAGANWGIGIGVLGLVMAVGTLVAFFIQGGTKKK